MLLRALPLALLVLAGCASDRNAAAEGTGSAWAVDSVPRLVLRDTALEAEPTLLRPSGATVLSSGVIVVADDWASAVRYFDASGALLRTVGGPGEGPGEGSPGWLGQCARDSVFVWDAQMSIRDSTGALVRELQPAGRPVLFECNARGRFVVVGFPTNSLPSLTAMRQNPDHRDTASVWVGAAGPDSSGAIGMLPIYENRIGGRRIQLAIGSERIFVGTGDSTFVHVYDTAGRTLGGFRLDLEPRPMSELHVRRALEEATAIFQDQDYRDEMHEMLPRMMPPPPEFLAPYFGFAVDPHDLLWIQLSAPGDGETRLRAVTETGAHVTDIRLPVEMTLWEVGDDYLLGTAPNADGVYGVVMYGLQRGTP
jgi:hypothetical protein